MVRYRTDFLAVAVAVAACLVAACADEPQSSLQDPRGDYLGETIDGQYFPVFADEDSIYPPKDLPCNRIPRPPECKKVVARFFIHHVNLQIQSNQYFYAEFGYLVVPSTADTVWGTGGNGVGRWQYDNDEGDFLFLAEHQGIELTEGQFERDNLTIQAKGARFKGGKPFVLRFHPPVPLP